MNRIHQAKSTCPSIEEKLNCSYQALKIHDRYLSKCLTGIESLKF